ncbi:MAG: hypothetical protein IV103_20200 [Zoogloea sp.]|nr:hypothetical protein [Zoogloea sp.]
MSRFATILYFIRSMEFELRIIKSCTSMFVLFLVQRGKELMVQRKRCMDSAGQRSQIVIGMWLVKLPNNIYVMSKDYLACIEATMMDKRAHQDIADRISSDGTTSKNIC